MSMRQLAERSGIPMGSYACMENGFYNISLDNLFRILGVLELEISDVWPLEAIGCDAIEEDLYLRRMQEFRLIEVINLSSADGGVLFQLKDCEVKVLLQHGLSEYLVERLHFYLLDGIAYQKGFWFSEEDGTGELHFFLLTENCPAYVRSLIRNYLVIWAAVFEES